MKRKPTGIGTGIGKRKCDYCVIDPNGKVLKRGQCQNTEEEAAKVAATLARRYRGRRGGCRAACETTANMWNTTYDAFEGAGIPIRLANTSRMALISRTGKKTDRVDAEKIAQIPGMETIPECYVPPAGIRGLRAMVRHHVRMVQDRTRMTNRIRSILDRHNATVKGTVYAAKNLAMLEAVQLGSPHDGETVAQCARVVRCYTDEMGRLDGRIGAEAGRNEYARLPVGMTGVGPYIALLPAAGVGDISRFAGPKNMVSWVGLCPTVHQSGDQKYMGRIKKTGTSSLASWAMCEAANVAVRHDPRMEAACAAARRRHADKHAPAIVVVANKMVTIAWHVLKTKTPYESRNEERYRRKLARMRKRADRK